MAEGILKQPAYVETLTKALERELPGAEVMTEQVRRDRYRFIIVYAGFDELDHPERQEQVWDIAERALDKSNLLNVTMILTLGPKDLERDEAGEGDVPAVAT